jgi:hypothetical protein
MHRLLRIGEVRRRGWWAAAVADNESLNMFEVLGDEFG